MPTRYVEPLGPATFPERVCVGYPVQPFRHLPVPTRERPFLPVLRRVIQRPEVRMRLLWWMGW